MTMSFLAMLISFAMMLTGVGGEGQPAEASRTLVLSDVCITYNGETVELAPSLHLGASTNGEKAVYDIGVDLDGETLFPMQLGADESGMTLLFMRNDTAIKVSADALTSLEEQLNSMMEGLSNQDGQNAELMNFMSEEFLPAYMGLLESMNDPEFVAQLEEGAQAAFDAVIDRGEGTPVTVEIDGTEYALTEYTYTIDADHMAQLVDAVYTSNDALKAYYDAMFKMFDMMPEESGMTGVSNYEELFAKTGLSMSMDVVEQVSDDGEIDLLDGTLTVDMSAMVSAAAEAEGTEVPEIEPIVMNIESAQVGEANDANVTCSYEVEGMGFQMDVTAHSEGTDTANMTMVMGMMQDGSSVGTMVMTMNAEPDEVNNGQMMGMSYLFSAEGVDLAFSMGSYTNSDGDSNSTVSLSANTPDQNFALSFNLAVTSDEIVDNANGHEATVLIDDLSGENLNTLFEDEEVQAAMTQVSLAMMGDSQKLMADESVQQLSSLLTPTYETTETYDYADDTFEGEEIEEYEYQPPEDDGELGYNEPQFTWLPDGWTLDSEEIDTAYDWVNLTYTDGNGGYCFVTFYQDYDTNQVNYIVDANGDIQAVDGREIAISDFGDNDLSVSLHEANLYGTLSFYDLDVDVETIGKIVAGIEF